MAIKCKLKLFVYNGLFMYFLLSCGEYSRPAEEALSLSAKNRYELEATLKHYQDNPLKLKAAEFLIANMVGINVPDTALITAYQPFYKFCDSIRIKYKSTQSSHWENQIDSLWNLLKDKSILQRNQTNSLLETITSKQLIREIDQAFKVWKENIFTKDCSFEDFCEYILPSYRGGGFVIDDARLRFYQLHKGQFYQDSTKSMLAMTDSVLSFYKEINYATFRGSHIPILSAEALLQIGGSRCTERGIFNSVLLSALGMPIAIDFVPIWANKVDAHSWNVLVVKGKHYAFDPFWNEDNWIYNDLYGNKGVYDPSGYGEFRSAKIYRKTYAIHLENTLLDKGIPVEDIPPLFRNYRIRDVSSDYFAVADVEISLTETAPQDACFAYLSVYGPKEWVIMQHGEINDGKAIFKGMGKNIIYLPVYYKNGVTQMAAAPFWLTEEGKIHQLKPLGNADETVVISDVEPDFHRNRNYLNSMTGANIIGLSPRGNMDTLCAISTGLTIQHTTFKSTSPTPYRYLRLNLPSDSIALGDMSFYSSKGKIANVKITSSLYPLQKEYSQNLLFDDFKNSCYRGKTQNRYVNIDLGNEYVLTAISFSPYLRTFLDADSFYELLYWENGWKLLGKQKGGVNYLTFKNVPRNVLFRLRQSTIKDGEGRERVFMYKDGEVIWM